MGLGAHTFESVIGVKTYKHNYSSHKVTMEESKLNAYIDSIQQLGAHNGVVSGLSNWFIVGRPRTW